MSPSALRRRIGQLLIAGFRGAEVPVELRALAREFDLGGVILFARNVTAPEQVATLCHEITELGSNLPPWSAVDQEGGRVARLRAPFTEWPPMAALGRSGDLALAERFARALAAELRAVGITLDFAPVLDVNTNPSNPVIGDRALADTAAKVAELGAIIIRAMQAEGVAACGKHFPGHGDTSVDSHLALPIVEHPPERLREVELVPFRAAIAADVATVMTAHVLAPALDEKHPATLSADVITGLLRNELRYGGVILSDDLEMKAIASDYAVPAAAVMAIKAGCDGVLVCSGDIDAQAACLEALIHAVEEGDVPRARVDAALVRQQRAKERFMPRAEKRRPASAAALRQLLGRDEHRAIADEMARFV
jgi:beta-N-acetylhexosaminidase